MVDVMPKPMSPSVQPRAQPALYWHKCCASSVHGVISPPKPAGHSKTPSLCKIAVTTPPSAGHAISVCFLASILELSSSNTFQIGPKRKMASYFCNTKRISQFNDMDNGLMRKYFLPDNISLIFDPLIPDDNDKAFKPIPWLLEAIDTVANTQQSLPIVSPFLLNIIQLRSRRVQHITQAFWDVMVTIWSKSL